MVGRQVQYMVGRPAVGNGYKNAIFQYKFPKLLDTPTPSGGMGGGCPPATPMHTWSGIANLFGMECVNLEILSTWWPL